MERNEVDLEFFKPMDNFSGMYEMPYFKNQIQDERIKMADSYSFFRENTEDKFGLDKKLENAIVDNLKSGNLEYLKSLTNLVDFLPIEKQDNLRLLFFEKIKEVFENGQIDEKRIATKMIGVTPEEKVSGLIELSLSVKDKTINRIAAKFINVAALKDRFSLFKKFSEIDDIEVLETVISKISFIADENKLESQEILINKIKDICKNGSNKDKKKAIGFVNYVLDVNKRESLTNEFFAVDDMEIKKEVIRHSFCFSDENEVDLVKKFITKEGIDLINEVSDVVWSKIDFNDDLKLFFSKIAKDVIKNKPINDVRKVVKIVDVFYDDDLKILLFEKLNKTLDEGLIEEKKVALQMIKSVLPDDMIFLFNKAIKLDLGDEIIKPQLYDKNQVSDFELETKKQTKSGETTLIGGSLKNKMIIRHLEPESFRVWQKLYENTKLWKDLGFDYVPIEPIKYYYLDEVKETVNVYAGILDINLKTWNLISGGIFKEELKLVMNKIIDSLNSVNSEHSHPHDENFCLKFFRNDDGKPDLNRMPKLYLIDFDNAFFTR